MLATRKLNSSGSFSDQLRNPSARFGGVLGERFPKAIDKSLGNGYHLGHGRGETLAAGFLHAHDLDDSHSRDFYRLLWGRDRKSTRLNSSHVAISYAVFC